MKEDCISILVIVALIVVGIIGYTKNIVKLLDADFQAPYKAEVVRTAGVIVPLVGVVEGFMTIEDK